MVAELLTPLDFSAEALALDAISEVGPGGHFFGTERTMQRYRDAFYTPILSNWCKFESWHEAGAPTAMQLANGVWKERLASCEVPEYQSERSEALSDFVSRRKVEGGVKTDF